MEWRSAGRPTRAGASSWVCAAATPSPTGPPRSRPGGTTGPIETLASTGNERLWLAPAVRVATAKATAVSAGLLIPIWENVRGTQLASGTGVRLGVAGTW